jgi:cobalt-zinc-cadmium efflux system protein
MSSSHDHGTNCTHDHDHSHQHDKHDHGHSHGLGGHHHHVNLQGKKLLFVIGLNLAISITQMVGAYWSDGLSLFSDALHNFSDVMALVLSYVALKFAQKKSSPSQTFGQKRAEIVAPFINSLTLLAISAVVVASATRRLFYPVPVESMIVSALGALGILVNGASVLVLAKEAKTGINMRLAYLHLLTDMYTSVGVVLGGLCIYFWKVYWVDSVISILIGSYLIYLSIGLIMRTLRVLMQFAPPDVELSEVEAAVKFFPQVKNVHHVHLWQLGEFQWHFEGHISLKEDLPASQSGLLVNDITAALKEKFSIGHAVIQVEYNEECHNELVSPQCV